MLRFYQSPNQNRVSVVGEFLNGELKLAVSRCSQTENFCKKVGRRIAENRFKDGHYFAVLPVEDETVKTFVKHAQEAAQQASNSPELINGRTYKGKR